MTCRGQTGWLVCEGRLGGYGSAELSVGVSVLGVCVRGKELLKSLGGIEGPQTDVGVLGVGSG